MQKRSWIYIMLLLSNITSAATEIDPVVKTFTDKTYLRMPNGWEIIISQPGKEASEIVKKRVFLRDRTAVLWDKTFGTDKDDSIWWKANFMPVVEGKFIHDIDGDGTEEISIGTWHGGNDITSCDAYVFSVKGDVLILKEKKTINYEFSRSTY